MKNIERTCFVMSKKNIRGFINKPFSHISVNLLKEQDNKSLNEYVAHSISNWFIKVELYINEMTNYLVISNGESEKSIKSSNILIELTILLDDLLLNYYLNSDYNDILCLVYKRYLNTHSSICLTKIIIIEEHPCNINTSVIEIDWR